jgi:hypothetical protein
LTHLSKWKKENVSQLNVGFRAKGMNKWEGGGEMARLTNDSAESFELAAPVHAETDILAALGLAFVAAT